MSRACALLRGIWENGQQHAQLRLYHLHNMALLNGFQIQTRQKLSGGLSYLRLFRDDGGHGSAAAAV
jgi:hypothetical protein